jgi:hypothetical protein
MKAAEKKERKNEGKEAISKHEGQTQARETFLNLSTFMCLFLFCFFLTPQRRGGVSV